MGQLEISFRELIREEVAAVIDKYFSQGRQPPARTTPPPPVNEYLTKQQAAEMMNYSPRTVTRLMDSGKLRPCGPRRDRISRFEIQRFMAESPPPRKNLGEDDVAAEADRLLDDE